MATESPLLHDGSQTVAGADYRNSTNSGTTHAGPSGSPQFQAVRLSTTAERTVNLCTASGQPIYGILQNKPYTGEAADVGIFGITKAVAGTTTVTAGSDVMTDSSGCMIPYTSAAGQARAGRSLTSPAAVGEVFTMAVYGFGAGGGSIA